MSLGNRYSQHSFSMVPSANVPRSVFDRSYARKSTFDFDYLVPFFYDEVLPGDVINLDVQSFIRLATQTVPVLDSMYIDFWFFFVPNRLVWDNWERFMGSQDDPDDSIDYLIPQVTTDYGSPTPGDNVWANGSIYDYFALPTDTPNLSVNALFFRSYNLIFNQWFRDQNLQDSLLVPRNDGPDDPKDYVLVKAARKHDYFSSCLPWPQKGDPVTLPLGTDAPVFGRDLSDPEYSDGLGLQYYQDAGGYSTGWAQTDNPAYLGMALDGTAPLSLSRVNVAKAGEISNLYTDLTEATGATINSLRQAFMLQSFLERDARGGTRYVEILRSHFNVISPDFRLQRPEFLSSSRITLQQHPIAQTSATEEDSTPQANLASFTTAGSSGKHVGFSKSFVEHGMVIGLMRARGEVTYQQGLNRMWSRQTRYDYFWPEFQQLGEQAVLTKEIYANGDSNDDKVFGYNERHAEYRFRPSEITGQFRSNFAQTLDVWHLAEEFSEIPALNDTFIQGNTPIERSLAVTEGYPHLLADFWFKYRHVRPMVSRPVPATLGRF